MKVLKLIICLLAVTVFVACSKKKDGGSQPYQGHNPYGLTTNELYGNNHYQGYYPTNPGYPIPQGCQAQQMFPDILSYCGWLARDGARFCQNQFAVKQAFLQYCQNYAVQFNYCVPQVRTGCFYTTGGCFAGQVGYTKTFRYKDRKRDSSLGEDVIDDGGDDDYIPPVDPNPTPAPQPSCVNVSRDCKDRNAKGSKKSELICKLPKASNAETNYVYTLEEYYALAPQNCGSTVRSQPTVPATTLPTVVVTGEREQEPVYQAPVAAPVQSEQVCTNEASQPWIDCRLKRADWSSAVRGTTKKQLREFDFKKDSSGSIPFEREVQRGNIVCKSKGATKSSRNYTMTYSEYVASLRTCGTVVVGNPTSTAPVSTAPVSSGGSVVAAPISSAPVAAKPNVDKCINLEEMHKFIVDTSNGYNSHQLYLNSELVNQRASSKFKTTWTETVKATEYESLGSFIEEESRQNRSAIGTDVRQTTSSLKIDNKKGFGKIEACRDDYMLATFKTSVGTQYLTVTWNKQLDNNMEMQMSWRGNFKKGSESSDYVINKFVTIEKGNSSRQKLHRNTVDKAERLGLIVQPQ